MYYRRKIFLALLETFSGKLNSSDFEKLLLLLCRQTNQNYYDFFPHKYGCFSFLSYQDKRVLIKNGYLKDSDKFELTSRKSFINNIKEEDRKALTELTTKWSRSLGNKLKKYTYLEYPEYAIKSEIAEKILNNEELNMIKSYAIFSDCKTLFTTGYEGLTIDAYMNKLIKNNIKLVIDVRKNPLSMKYGFSKTRLRNYLNKVKINYTHLPELGIVSKLRKDLKGPEDYEKLFDNYASKTIPNNLEAIKKITDLLNEYKRVTLTCFESNHKFCHRHKITEWLVNNSFNYPIVHI
jgi:uncharacterized protein (DUF488 family)